MRDNILGQNLRAKKFLKNIAVPDTDSREILLSGIDVEVDLMHDHSRLIYTVPVANTTAVIFRNPINKEERSLHTLTLDNAFSGVNKEFTFESDYVFIEEAVSVFTLLPGQKRVWYGCIVDGQLYLRPSVETI